MKRGDKTTAEHLTPGDRFYKVADKNKEVKEIIEHEPVKTKYRTYNLFYLKDGGNPKYPDKINSDTQVVFLRHKN